MNKQELNKNYYQTHKEVIKARQKERYQLKKTTPTPKRKSLGTYYHAHNIKVLISLKDYLESSSQRMKLWYRFASVLTHVKCRGSNSLWEIRNF